MKRSRQRVSIRSVLSRGINLTEREIAADLHFPEAGVPAAAQGPSANRAGRR